MTYIEKGTKEYGRASFALFLGGFVTFAILYTTQPLMPVFAKEFHVTAPIASLTLSSSTGVMAIAMLLSATLADAIGKKRLMVLSMFSTSILGLITAFSPNFLLLLLLRAMLGLFIAGIPSIAMAYVAEEFNPSGIGKIMGLYISGTSIGGLAGRMIISTLTDIFSWRLALIVVGVMTFFLSIAFLLTLPSSRHSVNKKLNWKQAWDAYKGHFRNRQLMYLVLLSFLLMGSFVTLFNYIGFLLVEAPYHLSQTVVGFIFIVYLFGTFSSIYMGKKADEFGSSLILKVSLGIMLGGAIFTTIPLLIGKIIGISIFSFGFFASHSVASTWVGDCAGKNKAQASSLYLLLYYLGSSIVGSVGGYFWLHFDWIGLITFISILLMIGILLVALAQKEERIPVYQAFLKK
ncbi:MFS transporter [Bacillus sp. 1NLA3E]|uniref:MFS transporter n=1 Tax=Bacillus sp. 1NLA3E TaxID=666686 RepID=UPI000247E6E7|nr:MFS transporter [Bacillus sp. 1NLA3E]AGK53291.1 major facilitator superfamily protein [Bacillus sp. 1NLA3E]